MDPLWTSIIINLQSESVPVIIHREHRFTSDAKQANESDEKYLKAICESQSVWQIYVLVRPITPHLKLRFSIASQDRLELSS